MYSIYIDKAVKKTLPAYTITNSDLAFLINFENIQIVVNPANLGGQKNILNKSTIKSLKALTKLNPYAVAAREAKKMVYVDREGKSLEVMASNREQKSNRYQYRAQENRFYDMPYNWGDFCKDRLGI